MWSNCNAHRIFILSCISVMSYISCLDAPHDNPYDPDNPNRASLSGIAYELGLYPVEGAQVCLMQQGEIVKEETSNVQGVIELEDIVPGIYDINGSLFHYSSVSYQSESLWAGQYSVNYRIEFTTLEFDDDVAGTSSPHRFIPLSGSWLVTEDIQQPEMHSIPHVYTITNSSIVDSAIALCECEAENFLFETKIKIDTTSGDNWRVGVVFRYQDANDFYLLVLSPETTYCDVVVEGQLTHLQAKARAVTPGNWHRLRVERPYGWITIAIKLNNLVLFAVYDDIFSGGRIGLLSYNYEDTTTTTVHFDDVTVDLTHGH